MQLRMKGNHQEADTLLKEAEQKYEEKSRVGLKNHIITQQERCKFCFENPTRPQHLVVAVGNFSYLMLPQWQSFVSCHFIISPVQHELATRGVDENIWEETRNFKKCLVMMFGKHGNDVIFLETVKGVSKQKRHCLVECFPLPRDIAKQAPVFFKKLKTSGANTTPKNYLKQVIKKGCVGQYQKIFHISMWNSV